MAVIFAVVGGGAVVAAVGSYSDHSDYSNYHDWHEYSDAAERKKRRIEAKNEEIKDKGYEINTYKTQSVNPYLESRPLINQDGVTVSVPAVERDGDAKIKKEENQNISRQSAPLEAEIHEIDKVISKIDKILAEGN